MSKILIFITTLGLSALLFNPESYVFNLDSNNFQKTVLNTPDIWLILFYENENEDFKLLEPEYEKAALALKDMFKLGAINIEYNKEFKSKYNLTTVPCIKFFSTDKNEIPKDFNTKPKAVSIIEKLFLKIQSFANNKINITDDEANLYNIEHDPNIVVLNDKNFDDAIEKNELMWMIAIYSPTCGVCKNVLPQWLKAAEKLKNKVVFAIIDGTINRKTAKRFFLKGYPMIKVVSPGFGNKKKFEDYDGPREEKGIIEYALKKLKLYNYVREPPQIINQQIIKDECINKKGYCIITIFPHIMKSSARERNNFIGKIHKVSRNYQNNNLNFLWAQEGDFRLEKKMKFNEYPVTIAVDFKKKLISFKKFGSDFNDVNLDNYIKEVLEGKGNIMEYVGGLEISDKEEWDRKDYMNEDL